ncbi:nitroreductase [Desulfobulbus propionicus DSM 2032]|jgi:nitroreductase|uniref:Nitroreductase n=1 Tax=Desulfobulbus propionicus (strain ATCC 33891 / DSM 2032 / VKM B-1956 / 1pr3) TaxID=577650 RepID=A0A7U3YJY9_DESPD|nr:nitroreductase family protein [Desulfobulbus propionicus]ADW16768.1 nitroreductase [Desulfobulbus propionicus DSM 2032]
MLIDLLRARRSIRRFTQQPVEPEKLDLLLEAALRSPSSKGNNPWEFIVVTDRDRLERLSVAKAHGATFLGGAPLAIVVCADPAKSDVWVEDASIAATLIHLEATDLGLGSCWVQIRLRQREDSISSQAYLSELFGLPEGMMVLAVVGIGYPVDKKSGHPRSSLCFNQVSYEQFGQRS